MNNKDWQELADWLAEQAKIADAKLDKADTTTKVYTGYDIALAEYRVWHLTEQRFGYLMKGRKNENNYE